MSVDIVLGILHIANFSSIKLKISQRLRQGKKGLPATADSAKKLPHYIEKGFIHPIKMNEWSLGLGPL